MQKYDLYGDLRDAELSIEKLNALAPGNGLARCAGRKKRVLQGERTRRQGRQACH